MCVTVYLYTRGKRSLNTYTMYVRKGIIQYLLNWNEQNFGPIKMLPRKSIPSFIVLCSNEFFFFIFAQSSVYLKINVYKQAIIYKAWDLTDIR